MTRWFLPVYHMNLMTSSLPTTMHNSFLLPFLLPRDSIKPNILDHVMSPAHYIQAHFGETVMSIQVFQRKVKKKSPSFRLCSNHNRWEKWLRRFRRVSATSSGLVFDAASSSIRYHGFSLSLALWFACFFRCNLVSTTDYGFWVRESSFLQDRRGSWAYHRCYHP